ncbi:hypothetical protein TNCV_3271501 [Trichonephila clavipes]|nr:hypothetical protein TNCV_3271501 [Trichonephila clavipes]
MADAVVDKSWFEVLMPFKPCSLEELTDVKSVETPKFQACVWYWARTRDKASHDPMPVPLGYRGHLCLVEIAENSFKRFFRNYMMPGNIYSLK